MKNKVCECCFWTICMYYSQNNVLITVISSGSYEADCVLLTTLIYFFYISNSSQLSAAHCVPISIVYGNIAHVTIVG